MYELTEHGERNVKNFIANCEAMRKEILDAKKDTACDTELPTREDILADVNYGEGIDSEGEYYNRWGVTDNYESPLIGLSVGIDLRLAEKKMLLIDVKKSRVEVVTADSLEEYYRLIDCTTVDIVTKQIAGAYYPIICDDEGLLVSNPRPSAILSDTNNYELFGNLLIAGGTSCEGELLSITEDQIKSLLTRLSVATDQTTKEKWIVIRLDNTF